jgi:hypothetical protein
MKLSKSRKGTAAISAAAIIIAVIIGIVYMSSARAFEPAMATVAEVDGDPITVRELDRLIELQRASVIDYFKRTHGAEYNKNFWQTSYNGEVPAQLAKQRALQEAVRTKIILQLAKSRGMLRVASYEGLLAEMDRENLRRKAAAESDQPVYGPVQFDEGTFMEFYMSRLLIQLKERLSYDELAVTDEKLLQHYESVKDTLFRLEDNVRFYRISVSYLADGHRMDSGMKLKAKEMMDSVKQRLEEGGKVDAAVKDLQDVYTGLNMQIGEERFDDVTARDYFKALPELFEALSSSLEAGQSSPVIDDRAAGQYVLAMIIGREANGYRSFEEQRDNVRKHYLDSSFNTYVNRLIERAEVIITD